MKSKVYFSREITPQRVLELYRLLGKELKGNVAIKVHSGETGNQNFLRPEFWKPLIEAVGGNVVECNTAYEGARNTTEKHLQLVREHGFLDIANVDIMDSDGDIAIPVNNGFHLKENYVGKNIKNYDSILMLSHFKGHPMGGFGGALKNMSIGCSSARGKSYIHSGGKKFKGVSFTTRKETFIESMADACKSVIDFMDKKIVYINVINNLSVDCDCVAHPKEICMSDIGIVSSIDPVALDKASLDLIYNSTDPGKDEMINRIESRKGEHIIDASFKLGLGNIEYELIDIDK